MTNICEKWDKGHYILEKKGREKNNMVSVGHKHGRGK